MTCQGVGTSRSTTSCKRKSPLHGLEKISSDALLTVQSRGADKSIRYVAEENITPLMGNPPASLMRLAGRYFKRWDEEGARFISNLRDEYPDD